ncbi:MAG: MBL fold metallo-hydrolase [bacterium]|nr:MBL fold metallo-hydrolase [bacterium]
MFSKILLTAFILAISAGTLYGGKNDVEITYFGHSTFLIKSSSVSIITDPFNPAVGFPMPDVTADIVTASHTHGDHNNISMVKGNPIIIRDNAEAKGIKFVAISSFHDNKSGTLRGNNIIFKWTLNDVSFAHFGDYGEDELTQEQYEKLKGTDIVFIPAGGFYTIDAEKALSIIQKINPKIAIIMHYRIDPYGLKVLASLDDIKKIIPGLEKMSKTMKISKSTLPTKTKIVYMSIE